MTVPLLGPLAAFEDGQEHLGETEPQHLEAHFLVLTWQVLGSLDHLPVWLVPGKEREGTGHSAIP